MDYTRYPEDAKKQHPSICFQCNNAVRPAALAVAEQGFVGCHAHMEEIKKPRSRDVHQEVLASQMLEAGIQCQAAATGWSSASPLDSEDKPGCIYNGILLIKGCVKCPYHVHKTQ